MLASFGHLDKNVVNDVARGFTITGDMPRMGLFEHRTESVAILAQGVDVLRSESFDSRFSFLHFSFCDGFHGCLPEWAPCAERRERAKATLGDGSPGRDFRTAVRGETREWLWIGQLPPTPPLEVTPEEQQGNVPHKRSRKRSPFRLPTTSVAVDQKRTEHRNDGSRSSRYADVQSRRG